LAGEGYTLGDGRSPAGERRLGHVSALAVVDPQGTGGEAPCRGDLAGSELQAAIDSECTTAGIW
jgi:hypothetical protein